MSLFAIIFDAKRDIVAFCGNRDGRHKFTFVSYNAQIVDGVLASQLKNCSIVGVVRNIDHIW